MTRSQTRAAGHGPAIRTQDVEAFLAEGPIAVIGASDRSGNFGRTVYVALRDHGLRPIAVHPDATEVAGDAVVPSVRGLPDGIERAIVMVPAERAVDVVADCARGGVRAVWLFRGAGRGAATPEAARLAHRLGMSVIDGACPIMFLDPVGPLHRLHRRVREARHAIDRPSRG